MEIARTRLLALLSLSLTACASRAQVAEPPPDPKAGTPVKWQGWTFNWSLRDREGLVLTDVRFQNRSVLKYAGVAEIYTVYDQGTPRVLDMADLGLGKRAIELKGGLDCSSGEWCKLYDGRGAEAASGNAKVMLHEERTGPNYLGTLGRSPGKTLVIWSAASIPGVPDGYTFVVKWKFRDDGALLPEIGASGVPQHLKTGDSSPTGSFIGRGPRGEKVFAPSHVHAFLYRFDFDVDGPANTVEEFNLEKKPATAGALSQGRWTPIAKEQGRPLNPETFRSWRVANVTSRNALGHARSYQLIPGSTGVWRGNNRGDENATHADTWVTVAKPGEFPRSSTDSRSALDALPAYVDGEAALNRDIVLWHWVTLHHVPRTEDWMHQPMIWCGVQLIPRDFLDAGPLRPQGN